MKKCIASLLVLLLALGTLTLLSGCGESSTGLDPDNPVTLSMWHVYGSQTESPLNDTIEEFNRTTGKETGVIISVESVTDSSAIDEALIVSAEDAPGAGALPDLFTAYPRITQELDTDQLLDWSEYYTEEELAVYVDDFLSEGYFDDKLLMMPIAKSTEQLFLNQTLYDRFAADSGISAEELTDFETLFSACSAYYDWSGGQTMFQINDFYHYFLSAVTSMDSEFIVNDEILFTGDAFRKAYEPMAEAAIYGGLCVGDGYASDRWKTGEVISNIGSTAGILYLRDYVTYEDNSTEDVEMQLMTYPVFAGGKAAVVQRGTGLFAFRNEDERKNEAAAVFAKWIAEKQHNLDFVTAAGYLPVTAEGFEELLGDTSMVENEKYRMLYDAAGMMYEKYTFCTVPLFDGSGDLQSDFETAVKTVLSDAHDEYVTRTAAGENGDAVMAELIDRSLTDIQNMMD